MDIVNCEFALVESATGRVLYEAPNREPLELYASEYLLLGITCKVVKSDVLRPMEG
jgi:hypothetical protein